VALIKFLERNIYNPEEILLMKHIFKKDLLDLGGMFIHPLAKQLNGSVKFFEFGAHATIHINIPFQ